MTLDRDHATVVDRPGEYWCRTEIAREYDRTRFGSLAGRLYRRREESLIRAALRPVKQGARVLDAACGTGRITQLLLEAGYRPTGCDVSSAMMSVARTRLDGHDVSFEIESVDDLPYPEASFDAVTCIGLLMHLDSDNRVRILRELARVCRGPLIVQYGLADVFQRARSRLTSRPIGGVGFSITASEMANDLKASGLDAKSVRWVLRGVSSSAISVLAPRQRPGSALERETFSSSVANLRAD